MNITINITHDTTTKNLISLSRALLALADEDFVRAHDSQPAVENNTGTLEFGQVAALHAANPPLEVQGVGTELPIGTEAPAPVKRGRKSKNTINEDPAIEPSEIRGGAGGAVAESSPVINEDSAEIPLNSQCRDGGSTEAAESSPLTIDDVRSVLQQYAAVNGVEAGLTLLKQFNANRISELAPENYAAFAAVCAV